MMQIVASAGPTGSCGQGPLKFQSCRVTPRSACWLVDKLRVFEAVVPNSIWVAERPVWFSGIRLRSRTTVVRLSDDQLWVHSPCTPTDEVCRELDALGEVRFVVVPNRYHHLETPATKARYPKALVVGPASAASRNPRLKLDASVTDLAYQHATPELTSIQVEGVPFLDETVFFHRASGSLIAADLLMSSCSRDHWTSQMAGRILGHHEKFRVPPDVRWNTRVNDAVARSIEQLQALPVERILVAHSDAITVRPVEQLVKAWNFALPVAL